jgi:hypothetical protein
VGVKERSPTALLLVRAWCEDGSASPLRAHVRWTADVSSGFGLGMTLTEADQIVDALRAFLEEVSHPRK